MTEICGNITLPYYNLREIYLYAGVASPDRIMDEQLKRYIGLCSGIIKPAVCFSRFSIFVEDSWVDFGFTRVKSRALGINLEGCGEALIFGASIGMDLDLLIKKTGVTDSAGAMWLSAIGSERIEALCNYFCIEQKKMVNEEGKFIRPRFSPGYGDLPLDFQREIFRVLDCPKSIGLSLTESLIMVPSKSVTAIVGISENPCKPTAKGCENCDKSNCDYRNGIFLNR